MKDFFKTVRSSIWDIEFYATVASRSLNEAVKYLVSLLLLATFITVVVISVRMVPDVLRGVVLVSNVAVTKYPADMILTFNNGTASTSEARPYVLPLPGEIFDESDVSKLRRVGVENLAVIDTRANFESTGQWREARALMLLTRNSIVTDNNSGGYEVKPIPQELKLTVDKDVIAKWVSQVLPIVRVVIPVLIILGFIGIFVGNLITYMIFALIGALIIWLIATLMKRPGHYREFLTAGIYAVTLAVVIDLLLMLFGLPLSGTASRAILVMVLVWMINVEIWKKPELPVANPPSPLPEIKE